MSSVIMARINQNNWKKSDIMHNCHSGDENGKDCTDSRIRIYTTGVFDYGRLDHWGHQDINWNTRSQSDKYMCRVQNDCTLNAPRLGWGHREEVIYILCYI